MRQTVTFLPLSDMANDIVAHLQENVPALALVRAASVTSPDQLFDIASMLIRLPVAVVIIGNATYENSNQFVRTCDVTIVLFDVFRKGSDKQAASIWDLTDSVTGVLSIDPQPLKIHDVTYHIKSFAPVGAGNINVSAVAIELAAVEAGGFYQPQEEEITT